MVEYQTVTLVVVGSSPITHPLFWNYITSNLVNYKEISFNKIKNKNNVFEKKIKILFKYSDDNNPHICNIIENFLKNLNNRIYSTKTKINYNNILTFKNLKKKKFKNKLIDLIIIMKKKQTYINICIDKKKIIHNTNGIILKKNGILEKSRKKEYKTSLLNLKISLNFLKNLNFKENLTINLKKIKPFLNKINKILKNEFSNKNVTYILTPEIPFNKKNFKKVKSIKRRLRKRFKLLDV